MKTKEFADLFGMSIVELARYTGYDRTALYNIIEGDNGINSKRFMALERLLIQKTEIDRNTRIKHANAEYMARMKALEDLHNRRQNAA